MTSAGGMPYDRGDERDRLQMDEREECIEPYFNGLWFRHHRHFTYLSPIERCTRCNIHNIHGNNLGENPDFGFVYVHQQDDNIHRVRIRSMVCTGKNRYNHHDHSRNIPTHRNIHTFVTMPIGVVG